MILNIFRKYIGQRNVYVQNHFSHTMVFYHLIQIEHIHYSGLFNVDVHSTSSIQNSVFFLHFYRNSHLLFHILIVFNTRHNEIRHRYYVWIVLIIGYKYKAAVLFLWIYNLYIDFNRKYQIEIWINLNIHWNN